MFKPNWDVFQGAGFINVLAAAGGQISVNRFAFFCALVHDGGADSFQQSDGRGDSCDEYLTVTYGSYMTKDASLERSALIIPLADTIIAIMAGLAIMPAVFASGLDPSQYRWKRRRER